MSAPQLDPRSVDHVLTTTRTVRRRLDVSRPVDEAVVLECLRIATQAPTGGNIQNWRWMIVTDPDKRAVITEHYRNAFEPYIAFQEQMVAPDNEQQKRVIASAKYLSQIMADIPVLVIPCALGRPDQLPGTGGWSNAAASGFYGSVWPAVWSFMLALRSRGFASALTTLHLIYEREVGGVLGIPDTVTQIGLIPVAHFKGEDFKPAKRRPVEEITYWNIWKETRS